MQYEVNDTDKKNQVKVGARTSGPELTLDSTKSGVALIKSLLC